MDRRVEVAACVLAGAAVVTVGLAGAYVAQRCGAADGAADGAIGAAAAGPTAGAASPTADDPPHADEYAELETVTWGAPAWLLK